MDEVLNTVDFLPSMLAMMGVESAGKEEGRDISGLLAGEAPDDWDDVTFMRGTGKPGDQEGWVSAVTPRYKLVLSSKDEPWLLDLEKDPDELKNYIDEADRDVLKALATKLSDYGKRCGDTYLTHPKTSRDLQNLLA